MSKEKELTMDDEEIDRIFHDATKDYEIPSVLTLPSPPESFTVIESDKNKNHSDDPYNWQYKLPSPPKAFRDQSSSPAATEYDTITISNLTDVINENKRLPLQETDKSDVIINNIKNTLYSQERNANVDDANLSKVILNGDSYVIKKSNPNQMPDVVSHTTNSKNYSRQILVSAVIENDRKRQPKNDVDLIESTNNNIRTDDEKNVSRGGKINCDKSAYVDANYSSTNDSGLGSDDSMPSVSEGQGRTTAADASEDTADSKRLTNVKVPERRGSVLQNFTITTYQNSKPTEIFHDDSVKTSKTTQLAKSNRPYAKSPYDKCTTDTKQTNGLSRHCSFNTEKTPNSAIKRSKSHISLLSGNFSKFNKFGKLNVREVECGEENFSVSTENLNECCVGSVPKLQSRSYSTTHLRKMATSEINFNKDNNKDEEELLELQDQVLKWRENEKRPNILDSMKHVTELQSLQVLKDILPQISQPQFLSDTQKSLVRNTYIEKDSDTVYRAERKSKMFVENGPTVNLQSWCERPKRLVSIKTDRDYVFSNNRKNTNVASERNDERSYDDREQERRTEDDDDDSRSSKICGVSCCSGSSIERKSRKDDSHVPIVRAVEFKKPYAQQTAGENLTKSTSYLAPVDASNRCRRREENEQKSKPACYLFGEYSSSNDKNAYFTPPSGNAVADAEPAKKYACDTRRVVTENSRNANHFDGHVEQNSCSSNGRDRTSKPNGTANKYKSVTDIRDDPSNRYGYANGGGGGGETRSYNKANENYTFKTYKNKLIENEKLNESRSVECQSNRRRSFANDDKYDTQQLVFKMSSNRKDEQRTEVVTARLPVAPTPKGMPNFKVSHRVVQRNCVNDNPRDLLLSSIKNFKRDNLRKLRVK